MRRKAVLILGFGLFVAIAAMFMGPVPIGYERHRLRFASLDGRPSTQVTDLFVMPLSAKEFADGRKGWRDRFTGHIRLRTVVDGRVVWRSAWSVSISGGLHQRGVIVRINS